MLAGGNGRMPIRPDGEKKKTTMFWKQNSTKGFHGNKSRKQNQNSTTMENCTILKHPKRSKFSPVRHFKRLGEKLTAILGLIPMRGHRANAPPPHTPKAYAPAGTKSYVAPVDAYRAEAIEDLIEFINSSSSLQRSKSGAS